MNGGPADQSQYANGAASIGASKELSISTGASARTSSLNFKRPHPASSIIPIETRTADRIESV